MVGEKDNKVTEEVLILHFLICFACPCFYSLAFPIEGFNFLPPKNWAAALKDQNKCVTQSPFISRFILLKLQSA